MLRALPSLLLRLAQWNRRSSGRLTTPSAESMRFICSRLATKMRTSVDEIVAAPQPADVGLAGAHRAAEGRVGEGLRMLSTCSVHAERRNPRVRLPNTCWSPVGLDHAQLAVFELRAAARAAACGRGAPAAMRARRGRGASRLSSSRGERVFMWSARVASMESCVCEDGYGTASRFTSSLQRLPVDERRRPAR